KTPPVTRAAAPTAIAAAASPAECRRKGGPGDSGCDEAPVGSSGPGANGATRSGGPGGGGVVPWATACVVGGEEGGGSGGASGDGGGATGGGAGLGATEISFCRAASCISISATRLSTLARLGASGSSSR